MQKACVVISLLLVLTACSKPATSADEPPPPFTPTDEFIGSNFFQVEFSDDSRSMTWCEQIPGTNKAKVFYADVDLETGLPNLTTKQNVATIQSQGWPYWGADNQGPFFLLRTETGEIKYYRRSGVNTLTEFSLGTVNSDVKFLVNVSSDPSKPYFYVSYAVLSGNPLVADNLYCFRSDAPGTRILIGSELPATAGSLYQLTFARWLKNSTTLAFPYRPTVGVDKYGIKFWYGGTSASRVVTNDPQNSHVDDLPFVLASQPADTFLFSSTNTQQLSIYKRQPSGFFSLLENYSTPTTISPYTLTSFEPFTLPNGKTYGAYQVYAGGGIPGNTAGEIWLKGIFGESLQTRISTLNGVTVDPEYVIGNSKIWIYYYGKPVGQTYYDLRRCSTPLVK